MTQNRIAGTLSIKVNGEQVLASGSFTLNLGRPKREAKVGEDRVHGYMEKPQVPFIEGEITVPNGASIEAFVEVADATVQVDLANGTSVVYRGAFYAADGDYTTQEGNLQVRYEALSAREI